MDIAHKLHYSLKEIMDIKKGEVALIIHDEYARQVMEVTRKALEIEGITVHTYQVPEAKRPLKEAPKELQALIEKLKPSLFFNQLKGIGEETPFRIQLHHDESMYGARVGHSPDINMGMIEYPMTADFKAIKANADKLKKRFEGVINLRVTAPGGTDIAFSIKGRDFADDITILPGHMGNLPAGEMWCAPVEDSMNGTIVCDGSIGDLGQVKAPLVMCVEDGYVTKLSSEDKELVHKVNELIDVDDEAALCGEFGIGLNPKARLTGLLLEDEKVYGTLHIAFGHNSDMPGGQNLSATHRDFLFKKPSIMVLETGEYIMRNGELT